MIQTWPSPTSQRGTNLDPTVSEGVWPSREWHSLTESGPHPLADGCRSFSVEWHQLPRK